MKIRITFEVDDEIREAIAHSYGESGKATRQNVIANIESTVSATWSDLIMDHETSKAAEKADAEFEETERHYAKVGE